MDILLFFPIIVLVIGAVLLFIVGIRKERKGEFGSPLIVIAMFAVVLPAIFYFSEDEKLKDNEIIQGEANQQLDTMDARVVEVIGNGKYQVIAGQKIYHAYMQKGSTVTVNFVEIGEFTGK